MNVEDAKIEKAEFESLPTPPPWLPVLLVGIIVVVLAATLKKKTRQRA